MLFKNSLNYITCIRKLFFLFVLVTLIGQSGVCQQGSVVELKSKLEKSKADTSKVRLLLMLDSIYLYKKPDNAIVLDSALLMANEARTLSTSLGFEQGVYEATFLIANTYAEKNDMVSAQAVASTVSGPLQVHIFLMIGERYFYRPGELKQNLDSAYIFLTKGKAISELINSTQWLYESLSSLGKYYYMIGQTNQAIDCYMRMINDFHHAGNLEQEAFWWSQMGYFMPDNDSTYSYEINAFNNALRLYRQLNNKKKVRNAITDIAYVHELHKKLSLAEQGYEEALKISLELGDTVLFAQFSNLSQLNLAKGNYDKSLSYAMQAVKNVDAISVTNQKGIVYYNLAEAYRALGETDKSLQWYYSSLDNLIGLKTQYLFAIGGHIVHAMIEKGNVKEALLFLEDFTRKNEPVRLSDKAIVAAAKAACFNALKKYAEAERYYLQMISLDKLASEHQKNNINPEYMGSSMNSSDAKYAIGRFYAERGNYPAAEKYLTQALTDGLFVPQMSHLSKVHLMLFKVDSAQGKYIAAINELQMYQKLNDSIFNEVKSRKIEELQIQYDTKKNEQDLQVSLANEKIQLKEIKETTKSRRLAYILVSALVILLSVLFSRYRLKQKSNQLLQAQQAKINSQNHVLSDLNNAQQKLLIEKEWLVKEIHHRVKNNLQIVVSLLNAQAAHLEEGDALMAIQESRHRMQVISLLHQKLYQAETSSLIDMQVYIREIVSFLKESFKGINHIYFSQQIDPISLDISQAVPVGLILNEAITNCIKYAFPDNTNGNINVTFTRENEGRLLLGIADNGIGMPKEIDPSQKNSLGMQLMQTLSEQLDGNIKIESKEGTIVNVCFKQQDIENLAGPSENIKKTTGDYA